MADPAGGTTGLGLPAATIDAKEGFDETGLDCTTAAALV